MATATEEGIIDMRKVILASASERRADILKMSGVTFDVQPSDFEEDLTRKMPPKKLAEELALGKALSVSHSHSDAVVIGADTFVVVGKKILGKPGSVEKAKEMLRSLSGKKHSVITGYAIIDTRSGRRKSGVVETQVWFRKLSPREIDDYVRDGKPNPRELAGAYAIQAEGARFVTRIEGDFYAVVGLPIARILAELPSFGVLS
jgi:septum formation protein